MSVGENGYETKTYGSRTYLRADDPAEVLRFLSQKLIFEAESKKVIGARATATVDGERQYEVTLEVRRVTDALPENVPEEVA